MDELLIEVYRPLKLDECVGNSHIIQVLKRFVKRGSIPNLFLSGPPGTGKTTAARCLISELGADYLDLNSSDERGIAVVQNRVKSFTDTGGHAIGNIKILFLDEVDSMTKDAQSALRRIMEDNSAGCRFILSCNYESKVIRPIRESRCLFLRFGKVKPDDVLIRIKHITALEKMTIPDKELKFIATYCDGDVRKAVNTLEVLKLAPGTDIRQLLVGQALIKPTQFISAAIKGKFQTIGNLMRDTDSIGYRKFLEDLCKLLNNLYKDGTGKINYDQVTECLIHCGTSEYETTIGANMATSVQKLAAAIGKSLQGSEVFEAVMGGKK